MPGLNLAALSSEQQAALLAKAAAARAAKTAARRRSSLRRDFLDAPEWERLASACAVRLPPWGEPPTPRVLERFLRLIGRGVPWYRDWSGERTLSDFAARNPRWPARAWAGCVLEQHAKQRQIVLAPDPEPAGLVALTTA